MFRDISKTLPHGCLNNLLCCDVLLSLPWICLQDENKTFLRVVAYNFRLLEWEMLKKQLSLSDRPIAWMQWATCWNDHFLTSCPCVYLFQFQPLKCAFIKDILVWGKRKKSSIIIFTIHITLLFQLSTMILLISRKMR